MPWIPRGLRNGIVTTRYPRHPDDYGPGFRGAVVIRSHDDSLLAIPSAIAACPTGAITRHDDGIELDQGRCILCGRCVDAAPEFFGFDHSLETSAALRDGLITPDLEESGENLARIREELAARTRALRRSVHVRHVDAGSDGSEEWEVAALTNPVYDVQRLGIFVTASPRHADVLLVTGVGSAGMRAPLRRTLNAMPHPKVVVAAGSDAISGGLIGAGYASAGGISEFVAVDVYVPGSPPSPFSLLHGILLAVGLLGEPAIPRGGAR